MRAITRSRGGSSGTHAGDAVATTLPAASTRLGVAPVPDEGVCHALGIVDAELGALGRTRNTDMAGTRNVEAEEVDALLGAAALDGDGDG